MNALKPWRLAGGLVETINKAFMVRKSVWTGTGNSSPGSGV
jgi:hypothetical protein